MLNLDYDQRCSSVRAVSAVPPSWLNKDLTTVGDALSSSPWLAALLSSLADFSTQGLKEDDHSVYRGQWITEVEKEVRKKLKKQMEDREKKESERTFKQFN